MTLDEISTRLEGVQKNGNGYVARCPAHEDHNPSLSVSAGQDGRVLLKRHAGCSLDAICGALRIEPKDLFAERNGHAEPRGRIVAEYSYEAEDGTELFQVVRLEPKSFRQRHKVNGEWIWNRNGVRPVLFRLPKVLKAVKAGLPVCITEGEKDVLTLEKRGFTATCNPAGLESGRTPTRRAWRARTSGSCRTPTSPAASTRNWSRLSCTARRKACMS
jgi:putative DNA primase/helicase